MKNKTWRIVGVVAIAALFGARMYFSYEQKKERERQQQMLYDLSRMQMEERQKNYKADMDSMTKTLTSDINLDEIQKGLDSLGKKLKEDKEKFEKEMKEIKDK